MKTRVQKMHRMKHKRKKQRKRNKKKEDGEMVSTLTEKHKQEDEADLRELAKSFTTSLRVTDRGYVVSEKTWTGALCCGSAHCVCIFCMP